MPTERLFSSAKRHLDQALEVKLGLREPDEDHLAAAMFNIMALLHFEESQGSGPAESTASVPCTPDWVPPPVKESFLHLSLDPLSGRTAVLVPEGFLEQMDLAKLSSGGTITLSACDSQGLHVSADIPQRDVVKFHS